VKPELTFRRSLRLILQRWWFVLLCGIGVAAGVLFAMVVAMQGIAGLILDPCLR